MRVATTGVAGDRSPVTFGRLGTAPSKSPYSQFCFCWLQSGKFSLRKISLGLLPIASYGVLRHASAVIHLCRAVRASCIVH